MSDHTHPAAGATTPLLLDASCDLRGTLRHMGDLRLLGSFDGQMEVSGLVEVGPKAALRGRATVGRLRAEGTIEAAVNASESVVLLPGGELRGGVQTPSLQNCETEPLHRAAAPNVRTARPAPAVAAAAAPAAEPDGAAQATEPRTETVGVLHRRRRVSAQTAATAAGR